MAGFTCPRGAGQAPVAEAHMPLLPPGLNESEQNDFDKLCVRLGAAGCLCKEDGPAIVELIRLVAAHDIQRADVIWDA